MDNDHTRRTGVISEAVATAWLVRQGYHVLHNTWHTGPVDMVALKLRPREVRLLDVKTVPLAVFAAPGGHRLPREREDAGIEALMVCGDQCRIVDRAEVEAMRREERLMAKDDPEAAHAAVIVKLDAERYGANGIAVAPRRERHRLRNDAIERAYEEQVPQTAAWERGLENAIANGTAQKNARPKRGKRGVRGGYILI